MYLEVLYQRIIINVLVYVVVHHSLRALFQILVSEMYQSKNFSNLKKIPGYFLDMYLGAS